MCVCIYACGMYLAVCMYACMYVWVCMMYVCIYVCMYVCMYVCCIYCPLQQYIHPHRKHTCCYFFMHLSFIRDIPFSQHSFYIMQSKFMQPFYVHAWTKTLKCQICLICF